MKTVNFIGGLIGITSMILGYIWFGWKLPLVIYLALFGAALERHGRK